MQNETGNDDGKHFFTVALGTPLLAQNEYRFYAEFVAPISRDRANGLYLSTYIDPATGEERYGS
jgi:hypothetical protein